MTILFFVLCILLMSCGNEKNSSEIKTPKKEYSVLKTMSKEQSMIKYKKTYWMKYTQSKQCSNASCDMSWKDALNACPSGWHLPDQYEWEMFIGEKYPQRDSLNIEGVPFSNLFFWTSSYRVSTKKDEVFVPLFVQFFSSINSNLMNSPSKILCAKDEDNEKSYFKKNENFFYGIADLELNQPSCIDGNIYLDYSSEILLICDDNSLKSLEKKLKVISDTVDSPIDSVVSKIKFLPPCSVGMKNHTFMLGDFRMFTCTDYGWKSVGILKQEDVIRTDIRDKNVDYKVVRVDSVEWIAENLNRTAPGSACYENKKENCLKYGQLYNSNVEGLCPNGWRLPRRRDWVALFSRFGLNGAYIRSKEDWFLDFRENKDVGLSVYPAGYYDGDFTDFSMKTGWWSYDDENVLYAVLFDGERFSHNYSVEKNKYYVRCLRVVN